MKSFDLYHTQFRKSKSIRPPQRHLYQSFRLFQFQRAYIRLIKVQGELLILDQERVEIKKYFISRLYYEVRNSGFRKLVMASSHGLRWYAPAIEVCKGSGMIFNLARNYTVYADLFKRKGDQAKAKENLARVIEIYKDCGADGWVKKAEEKMTALP
jgi:hypothetical protein